LFPKLLEPETIWKQALFSIAAVQKTRWIAKKMNPHKRQLESWQEELPPGCPQWITRELLVATVSVWQKYSTKPLNFADALEILLNTSALLSTLENH
jgi:hypothetical protein